MFSPLFLHDFSKEVWKDHLVPQRGGFLQYPRKNALRLADCSLRDHIKRFGKCHCFLYCCCCCVFPLPNNGLPGQSPLTGCQIPAYRVSNSHPASAIFLSPSGPGPLPQPGSIVWSQAARAGPRLAQTYSLHSLEDCQWTHLEVKYVTLWINYKDVLESQTSWFRYKKKCADSNKGAQRFITLTVILCQCIFHSYGFVINLKVC